jgi:hypothetical protein
MAKKCESKECVQKTTKKEPAKSQVINWRIGLKNGQQVDLSMHDGDEYDHSIRKWLDAVSKGSKKYYSGKFPGGEAWISGTELSTAVRTPLALPAADPDHYEKVA